MSLEHLLNHIRNRECESPSIAESRRAYNPNEGRDDNAATLYRNSNPNLAIDFCVHKLPLAGLHVMDPRLVRIAPGARNECHRHAHESIFVVLSGQAQLRLGNEAMSLKTGDIACVPRWVVHQSLNTSTNEELLILAITDFGLTSAVLGNYDHQTRLSVGGKDSFAVTGSSNLETT
jgi:quercetin dioxygenase-like cupin family protein